MSYSLSRYGLCVVLHASLAFSRVLNMLHPDPQQKELPFISQWRTKMFWCVCVCVWGGGGGGGEAHSHGVHIYTHLLKNWECMAFGRGYA